MSYQAPGQSGFATQPTPPLEIAMVIEHGVTVTDVTVPYEVLCFIPGAAIKFVAEIPGPKRADSGMLSLVADYALSDVPYPDIILVPAADFRAALLRGALLDWLQRAHQTARWTTSVCAGALVLGAAGLLRGKRATTHWGVVDQIAAFGGIPCPGERWVVDGSVVTAAGISAGIDMALWLTAQLAGDEMARGGAVGDGVRSGSTVRPGSPAKASPGTVTWVRRRLEQELAGRA